MNKVNDLADMLTGKSGETIQIKLENGHEYTATINGQWCSITPHGIKWTQEEIDDPSISEKEWELVEQLAYKELSQRKQN